MAFVISPKSTVLFVGDSITDCGRMVEHRPLGNGFVSQIHDLIAAKYPKHRLRIINRGVSGDTVRDLTSRWSDDVIAHQPDWISIKVGVNDAVRWNRRDPDRAICPQEFRRRYDQLLERATEETEAKLVLVTPFLMTRDTADGSWRSDVLRLLPEYIKTVRKLAKKYDARLVNTHRLFQRQLRYVDLGQLGDEPVHPNARGHMVIANAWLEAMDW